MSRESDRQQTIVADIGGTKTTVAWIDSDGDVAASATYPSRAFSGLDPILRQFFSEFTGCPNVAVFAVAGPVTGRHARVTNLPWTVSADSIRDAFDIPRVLLLNDVEALAWAIPRLSALDLHTLQEGAPIRSGPSAILAPGTGLGQAFLVPIDEDLHVFASEGGHVDFAPTDKRQRSLLDYLSREYVHVSFERIASGSGLPDIHRFLREDQGICEEASIDRRLSTADDQTPIIIEAALEGTSELCIRTIDLFVSVLGAEAGNLALKVLATGGIYLGGGLPPRILPFLESAAFLEAFRRKGRLASLMTSIPIHVILQTQAALLGAARYALIDQRDKIRRES